MRTRSSIPPHLEHTSWLIFEQNTAFALCKQLSCQLKELKLRANTKQVHDTRVMLRRFMSIWDVLKKDGWQSKKFQRKVMRKLRTLLKLLGKLRDCDVNLELAKALVCPKTMVQTWSRQRAQIRRLVKRHVHSLDVEDLTQRLTDHLLTREGKIRQRLGQRKDALESAYNHLNKYLTAQEKKVRQLESKAQTAEELHQLRLGIKRWRYLLTEFFGLTNLQLVKGQQLLGKLHDLDRLSALMVNKNGLKSLSRLDYERQKLLAQFNEFRKNLPWGLRPLCVSF